MTRFTLSLSALALCAASPAMAQVTASELWAEWQAQGAAQGQTLTAQQVEPTANGLILRGFTTTFMQDDVTSVGRADQIALIENGDGTVTVQMAELYDISVTFPVDPGDPPATIGLEMRHDGLQIVAGGTVAARSYTYSADSITITDGTISGGGGLPPSIDLNLRLRGMYADYLIDGSDPQNLGFVSSGTLDALTMGLNVEPAPPETGQLKTSLVLTGIGSEASGSLGTVYSLARTAGDLDGYPDGFAFSSALNYESVNFEMGFVDGGFGFDGTYANGGGGMDFSISEAALLYGFVTNDVTAQVTGTDVPVPIDVSASRTEFLLDMPLQPSDAPAPFAARIGYLDVTMGEAVWGLFDPAQAIPRDPISVLADVTGTVQVLLDLMSVEAQDMDRPPFELRDMRINDLRVAVGGAELTGNGALNFAPGQIVPQPIGVVNLALSGGMTLLDRLQASGLVPIEQIAMVRGMAGALTRPGPTPDTLETTLEFTPGGGLIANGVPLQ
jgi:hypothetical protein